jgi:hypothetical protein
MMTSTHVGTPMAVKLTTNSDSDEPLDKKMYPYPKLIGKLLYRSNFIRPDITIAIYYLIKYKSAPTVKHWGQANRILRYLKGTLDLCLTFNGKISTELIMWQDSLFADGDQMRSRFGFVAMVCCDSVTWGSRLHTYYCGGKILGPLCRSSRSASLAPSLHQLRHI